MAIIELKNIEDIRYIQKQRDNQLDRFVDAVKGELPTDTIENIYKSLMRLNNQMRLMEDSLIIYTLAKTDKLPNLK